MRVSKTAKRLAIVAAILLGHFIAYLGGYVHGRYEGYSHNEESRFRLFNGLLEGQQPLKRKDSP